MLNIRFYSLLMLTGMLALRAAAVPEPIPDDLNDAKWIWHITSETNSPAEKAVPAAGTRFFRNELILPENDQVARAGILITADNSFTLYINGKPVGTDDNWSIPTYYEPAKFLKPGRNIIAVEAENTADGPAGLICKMEIHLAGAERVTLVSDNTWKSHDKLTAGWNKPDFKDDKWKPAHEVDGYGSPPWGKIKPGVAHSKTSNSTLPAPEKFDYPARIAFISEDCSLTRTAAKNGGAWQSLTVTVFSPRDSRAYPEHDLPGPMKVGRKLCTISPSRKNTQPKVLVDAGKGAIGSPSVSYDGKWIYFSMAYDGEPFFHLYKIPADGGKPTRITEGPFHDIDPVELPDGRFVFTSTRIGRFEEYHCPPSRALFIMNADGSNIFPLSNTFIFDNEPEVMSDGRLIFVRSDNFFDRGKVETRLHAMRPDGTGGQTVFGLENGPEYGGRLRAYNCGSPAPMPDGRVAFVSGPGITLGLPGCASQEQKHLRMQAGDVAALPDGRLLCTIAEDVLKAAATNKKKRTRIQKEYTKVCVVDPDSSQQKPVCVYESDGPSLHSPVYLGERKKPPVLADLVDHEQADKNQGTGVLFCQNARLTLNTTAGWKHVRAIRVLASRGLTRRSSHSYLVHAGSEVTELGTVPLAPDGSFAVEVPADTGIAFQAVDAEGRSELNEMSWIYVRPNEFRGCVGCHAARKAAPPGMGAGMKAMRAAPLKLLGKGTPHSFRGNNAAVTGLMELQFDRYREVAGINRHNVSTDSTATGKDEINALIEQVKNGPGPLRISAIRRLAVFRAEEAAEQLAKVLEDKSREIRVAAATALSACGDRSSVKPLLKSLSDSDPLTAQAAAIALENLTGCNEEFDAFSSSREEQADKWREWFKKNSWKDIETELIARLKNPDRDIVRRAAVALGHIGGLTPREPLRLCLKELKKTNPAIEWRKKHKGDGAKFNSLAAVNPRTIQAVARALGNPGDDGSVPVLVETLNEYHSTSTGNLFVAEAAVEALGLIGTSKAEEAMLSVFPKLDPYIKHTSWYGDHGALMACHASPVHYFIMEALDRMGSKKTDAIVPDLINSVPTDTDRALLFPNDDYEILTGRLIRRSGKETAVTETCLNMLGSTNFPADKDIVAAISKVHSAWGGAPTPEIRAAQILSLTCRDKKYEPAVRSAFERYMKKTTDIKRVFETGIPRVNKLPVKHWTCFFLARSLANLASKDSADVLIAALKEPAEAAGGYPDPTGPGVLFLHNDLTPCWRAAAAWALGEIGDKKAVPALIDIIKDLKNATDTRYAAAEALQKLAGPKMIPEIKKLADECPDVSTRRALYKICNPRDWF